MTTTLGYRDPETGRDFVVELGVYDDERGGYWAIEINPDTRESMGGVFFANDADFKEYGKPNARNAWIAAAESAREAHHLAAGEGGGQAYANSQKAFAFAIRCAYPELDAAGVYGIWVDCMESVDHCARQFAKMDREDRQRFIAMGRHIFA